MKWDTIYTVSKNVVIRSREYDQFVVTGSISSFKQTEFDSGALRGLSFFQAACTPTEAFKVLGPELNVSKQEFQAAIEEMVANGLLVPYDKGLSTIAEWRPEESGFGRLESQHRMLADLVRVLDYRSAIFQQVRGKTVLEIGCGTGILSIFAAQAGAKKVIAVEESKAILTAQQMAQANRCQDTISFVSGNSLDIEIDQKVDVVIHELIGKDPFNENMLLYIDDARRRFLKSGGILLPKGIDICCYGVESSSWRNPQRLVNEAEEFQKSYGVNFEPYIDLLQHNRPSTMRIVDDLGPNVKAILSREASLFEVDFNQDLGRLSDTPSNVDLTVEQRGKLNAILVFFRVHLDDTLQLSSSPHTPPTHWGWALHDLPSELSVAPGDQVNIEARIATVEGRERIVVSTQESTNAATGRPQSAQQAVA